MRHVLLSAACCSIFLTACVSQQSSFDYTSPPQPIPSANSNQSGIILADLETGTGSNEFETASLQPAENLQPAEGSGESPLVETSAGLAGSVEPQTNKSAENGNLEEVASYTEQNSELVLAALDTNIAVPTARPTELAALTATDAAETPPEQAGLVQPDPAPVVQERKKSGIAGFFSSIRKSFTKPRPPSNIKTASVRSGDRRTTSGGDYTLPGVKSNAELFGIEDEETAASPTTQVAALGGFARISPNGLRIQHEKVKVSCLKPGVLRLLRIVERRYGKKPIITSGYRSPKGNRRAGGARNSQHIFCKAVDIQVEGVDKWSLAKYLRTIPGRGGVGTYCRTQSVHLDIGSKRDWHHPCRRSTVRKRKKRT